MINFIRIELFKLLRKREFYIIHLCLCCLTLLFEFLIGSNSTIIEGSENSIGGGFFLVFMIEFYSMLFILPIFSAIFVIGIWSKELRNGTLCQMIVRARSRGKVYFSKLIVQTLAVFSVLINVVVISIVGYGIIGRRGAYYSSDFFNVVGEKLIWYLVLNILFLISFSYLVMLISMKNDSTKTLIISVIVLVTLTIIQRIDKIREFVPSYYGMSNYVFSEDVRVVHLVTRVIILILLSVICILGGKWIQKECEF